MSRCGSQEGGVMRGCNEGDVSVFVSAFIVYIILSVFLTL